MTPDIPVEVQQMDALHSASLSPFFRDLIAAIYSGVTNQNLGETLHNFWLLLPDYAVSIMLRLFTFSFILSLLLIFVIIWSANNLMRIRRQMHEALALPGEKEVEQHSLMPEISNEKWERVVTHINSANPSDWKLAILECDIILSDILEKMGYLFVEDDFNVINNSLDVLGYKFNYPSVEFKYLDKWL